MSTTTMDREQLAVEAPIDWNTGPKNRLFAFIAMFAIVLGAGSMLGGLGGAIFTWDQAAAQNVTTPEDAVFPEVPVRGPLSMWAQADIITQHQLDGTEGLYYAEMDRMVQATDESGEPLFDEAGEAVMVPNEARASWIGATTLTTSLSMGILAYALSAFAFLSGAFMVALGFGFRKLRTA